MERHARRLSAGPLRPRTLRGAGGAYARSCRTCLWRRAADLCGTQRAGQPAGSPSAGCGVRAETRVGILLERSVEMAVALLAILKAGGGYVAFDPSYPAERLRYMLEDSGVTLILTEQHVMANQPEINVRSILIDEIRTRVARNKMSRAASTLEHRLSRLHIGIDRPAERHRHPTSITRQRRLRFHQQSSDD